MTKEGAKIKADQYLVWAAMNETKAQAIQQTFNNTYSSFDWTEPIKPGHHSQRRHERVFERRDRTMRNVIELEAKAQRMREKAGNLLYFSTRNKGDAEHQRQEKRGRITKEIAIGVKVSTMYGLCEIQKINKITVGLRTKDGWEVLLDKSLILQ